MDPYSGISFGGTDRPSGMWFVDFGMEGWGAMLPFMGVWGVSAWAGGRGAAQKMFGAAQRRGTKNLLLSGRQYALEEVLAGQRKGLLNRYLGGGSAWAGRMNRTRVGAEILKNWGQFETLSDDIASLGKKTPAKQVLPRLYNKAMRQGANVFERYGMGTGSRIMWAGMTHNAFRFLETIAVFSIGAELGKGLMESITNWQPTVSQGPQVDFGDVGFVSQPAAATTQRQRALSAIHNSQLGVRAALGNEASFMHG